MDITTLMENTKIPEQFYYWRYHYNLFFTAVQDNHGAIMFNGPAGFGLLITETDEFPTDKLLEALSTPHCQLHTLNVWQVSKEEYERLKDNNINDYIGAVQQYRQKEMIRQAIAAGTAVTQEELQEISARVSQGGPTIKHSSQFTAQFENVLKTQSVSIPVDDDADIQDATEVVNGDTDDEDAIILKYPGAN